MTTNQDCSVGHAKESTYGTSVTPTRFQEFVSETFGFRKSIKQGQGLRVSSRVARSARRVVTSRDAGGDLVVECTSKGMGLLWEAALGSGVSNLVSAATYQQVFTLGDTPPSHTIQVGLPLADGSAVHAYTYVGAMVDSWELACDNDDIARLTTTWDCRDVGTGTAYASPSYAASPNLFHYANGALYSGTLTAPTTTALGSAGTPLASIRSATIRGNNNLAKDRFNFGAPPGLKDKPVVGLRELSGTLTAEYNSTAFRDAILNETPMTLVVTYTAGALGTGNETLQVILPEIKIDGDLPQSNGGELITHPVNFTGLDNLTAAQPIWVVMRTADAAL